MPKWWETLDVELRDFIISLQTSRLIPCGEPTQNTLQTLYCYTAHHGNCITNFNMPRLRAKLSWLILGLPQVPVNRPL
jgi:hypothetical protein